MKQEKKATAVLFISTQMGDKKDKKSNI